MSYSPLPPEGQRELPACSCRRWWFPAGLPPSLAQFHTTSRSERTGQPVLLTAAAALMTCLCLARKRRLKPELPARGADPAVPLAPGGPRCTRHTRRGCSLALPKRALLVLPHTNVQDSSHRRPACPEGKRSASCFCHAGSHQFQRKIQSLPELDPDHGESLLLTSGVREALDPKVQTKMSY